MNAIAGLLNPLFHLANIRRPKSLDDTLLAPDSGRPIDTAHPAKSIRHGTICSIPPGGMNGFAITAWVDSHGVRVCFGGLEQDFDSVDEATLWIQRALTSQWQLRIEFCGRRPFQWTLEPVVPNACHQQLSFGYPIIGSSFKKKWSVQRRNTYDDMAVTGQLDLSIAAPKSPSHCI